MTSTRDERPPCLADEASTPEHDSFDDISVPGIGVRAALGDEQPASSEFWRTMRDRSAHAARLLPRAFVQVGNMASRLSRRTCAGIVANVASGRECIRAWPDSVRGFALQQKDSLRARSWEVRKKWSYYRSPRMVVLLEAIERLWAEDRSRTLQAARTLHGAVQRVAKYRPRLPSRFGLHAGGGRRIARTLTGRLRNPFHRNHTVHPHKRTALFWVSRLPAPEVVFERNLQQVWRLLRGLPIAAGRGAASIRRAVQGLANDHPDMGHLRRAAGALLVMVLMVAFVVEVVLASLR